MAIDVRQFHQTFFEESLEGLIEVERRLLGMEAMLTGDADATRAVDPEELHTVFRVVHSIKGSAGTLGFGALTDFAHIVETLLDDLRSHRIAVITTITGALLKSVDVLRGLIEHERTGHAVDKNLIEAVSADLEAHHRSGTTRTTVSAAAPSVAAGKKAWRIRFHPHPGFFATGNDPLRIVRDLAALGEIRVRVDLSRLPPWEQFDPESCHLGWEFNLDTPAAAADIQEVFAWVVGDSVIEIAPERRASRRPEALAVRPTAEVPEATKSDTSIRVSTQRVDALVDMVGELVITHTMLNQVVMQFTAAEQPQLLEGIAQLERHVRQLQESVIHIRMLPIGFAFNRLPRLVHDLSEKLGKSVELRITGESTELDKVVLEKIVDPLVHLVRNSLDHGIELPAVRRAANKPERGVIEVTAYQKGGNIVIEIADDGAGLNRDKILARARERGLVQDGDEITDEGVHELIFHPGFSTADSVTDVSGRGVGMDVVRQNIRALCGQIELRSRKGKGMTVVIRLPLTLAILDGQSTCVGTDTYIIPLMSIVESIQVGPGMVHRVAGKGELLRLRNDYLPVIRLHEILGLTPRATELTEGLIVVVEADDNRVGLFVDGLLGQQQVVIKTLETNFRKVEGISGATVLGDGTVALILDVAGLIHATRRHRPWAREVPIDDSRPVAA